MEIEIAVAVLLLVVRSFWQRGGFRAAFGRLMRLASDTDDNARVLFCAK